MTVVDRADYTASRERRRGETSPGRLRGGQSIYHALGFQAMVSAGSSFGPYRIISLVGAGGMGEVYHAHDPRLGRDVAIKILSPALGGNADAVARLTREARAIAALSHPGILTIHDIGQEAGQVYLVTELLEGVTLRRRLLRGPLPWREALEVATMVASALAAAHTRGIVHRDLKPENVFLTPDGSVKILDFGVAKLSPAPAAAIDAPTTMRLTAPGAAVGTLAYMAPEQLEGLDVDHRADQFAFGILLHEIVSGQHPFPGETAHEIAAAILRDTPRPLGGLSPQVPAGLSRVVLRCLARRPAERYASTTDLALALNDVRADSSVGHRPPLDVPRRFPGWVRWAGGAAATLAVVAAGVVELRRSAPAVAVPASIQVPERTVAVLPFTAIGDGETYFADGVTEAVTRELGRVKTVRVIASNSVFAYRDRSDATGDIGRELGAGLIVRGSVQRAGGRVRINTSLLDIRQGTTLWSESYDRDAANVLAIQDDIAWQVAAGLATTIGSPPPARPPASQTTTPAAYDAYLRGLSHMTGRSGVTGTGRRLTACTEAFERAVALDPNFALARASLASAYTQRFFYDATEPEFEQKAFLEIEKALAINPDQAEAYVARAQLIWNVRNGFQHEQAISDLRLAVSHNPSLAEAHIELGKIYYHIGLLDKAIAENEEALRLDPLATPAAQRRLMALFDSQRFTEGREVMARNPRWLTPAVRGEGLLAMGDPEAALRQLLVPPAPGAVDTGFRDMEPSHVAALAHSYAKLSRTADAERALRAVIPRAVNSTGLSHIHHAQFSIASAMALMGRPDEAVRWLTKAADEGYPSYPKFSTSIDLVSLKAHPAFIALLDRLQRDWNRWRTTL